MTSHRRPPLDTVPSLKIKLGAVIFAAVGVTVFVFWSGIKLGLWPSVSGIVAAVLALVIVRFLARGMTSPLREMADAAGAMAKGDYERRVTATSRDEVGTLARAFNQMAAELAETDRVRRGDEVVHLTPTEFDLLAHLAAHPGQVFTRTQLLDQVWGYADGSGARTVDSHVRALRRKLGSDMVRTVHGVGYAAPDPAVASERSR